MSDKIAQVDAQVAAVRALAEKHGFVVTREDCSGLSCSRYIGIDRQGARGFDAAKSDRRRFCAETKMPFPSFTAFNVRISDHHGYGDGTTVHHSIRLDLDVDAAMARLDGALAILAEIAR